MKSTLTFTRTRRIMQDTTGKRVSELAAKKLLLLAGEFLEKLARQVGAVTQHRKGTVMQRKDVLYILATECKHQSVSGLTQLPYPRASVHRIVKKATGLKLSKGATDLLVEHVSMFVEQAAERAANISSAAGKRTIKVKHVDAALDVPVPATRKGKTAKGVGRVRRGRKARSRSRSRSPRRSEPPMLMF